jgi:glycosyltransferase involved in cell wall biosynthesis
MGQKEALRKKNNLPTDKKIILMGATSALRSEKGGEYVAQIIEKLDGKKYAVALFGEAFEIANKQNDVEVIPLGMIYEEHKMREIYNCADVFVATSRQEAFGYTVCESLCCGTPVVAFAVGGICDQIVHKRNGFLARPWNVEELVEGIEWAVNQEIKGINLLDNSPEEIGRQYLEVIER